MPALGEVGASPYVVIRQGPSPRDTVYSILYFRPPTKLIKTKIGLPPLGVILIGWVQTMSASLFSSLTLFHFPLFCFFHFLGEIIKRGISFRYLLPRKDQIRQSRKAVPFSIRTMAHIMLENKPKSRREGQPNIKSRRRLTLL